MAVSKFFRVTIRIIAALTVSGVVAIAALLGVLWIDHGRESTLPTPTGPFAVGHTIYVWKDPSHADPMAPQPSTRRELLATVWYPAAPQPPSQKSDEYVTTEWRTAYLHQVSPLFTRLLNRDMSRVQVHGIRDAEMSPQQHSYPVVFMRAGASAEVANYTTLAEDLASHGYVVVGFDAPYRTSIVVFPDGRVILRAPKNNVELVEGQEAVQLATKLAETWSADISFALDEMQRLNTSDPSGRFVGRLDLERVGAFGHSLGGATALQFCHDDSRCKAGIDVDGLPVGIVVREGLGQPFMFLLGDHKGEPDAEVKPVMANFQSIYDRLPVGARWWITLRGANHYQFGDGAYLRAQPILWVLQTLGILRLDGQRQLAITKHYIHTFFDVYLKGAPVSELRSQRDYPEVEYVP